MRGRRGWGREIDVKGGPDTDVRFFGEERERGRFHGHISARPNQFIGVFNVTFVFSGECWGGSDGYTFSMDGPSAKCVDEQEDPCDMVSSHACAGKADAMFVYYAP